MLRATVVFLLLAAIAGFFAYRHYQQDQANAALVAQQIADLNAQVQKLQSENNRLRDNLAKVQEENVGLNGYNDELKKALETARVTGKVPLIKPYPPK